MASRPKPLVSFADVGKQAKDLLSKPFFAGSRKLTVVNKTADGVKFTVEGKQGADAKVTAELKAEFKDEPKGFEITEKWDNTNKISVEVALKDHVTPGLKFKGKGELTEATDKQISCEVSASYEHEMFNGTLTVDGMKRTAGLDLTAGSAGFVAGVSLPTINIQSQNLGDVHAKVGFVGTDYNAQASATKNFSAFGFSYWQKVSSDATVVGQFELPTEKPVPTFTIGGEYKTSADTTINAKADSTGKCTVAYSAVLRPGVTAGVCAEFDGCKLDGAKTGFSLKFE